MKVFIVGGTGLLGWHTLNELLARGHSVSTVALPPLPVEKLLPDSVTCSLGNIFTMKDDELLALLRGHDALFYAAGLDDRAVLDAPAYPKFHEANVIQCERVLALARRAGIRKALVCGPYFTYCDGLWPSLKLGQRHPYIRSRLEQKRAVLAMHGPDFSTGVLELPYIFGTMPGRKPLWTFLIEMLRNMGRVVFFPLRHGGTAMVTVKQVAQAAAGALEGSPGGRAWPIGGINMAWSEFLPMVQSSMGGAIRLVHAPKFVFTLGCKALESKLRKLGKEGGLSLGHLADILYRDAYIDPEPSMKALGYGPDDVRLAIKDAIDQCV